MLTTANPEYDRKFRLWRQHSMSVPDTVRHGAREVIFESYPEVGFNYRMTDMQAAVGRVQLTRLPEILAERRRLARVYADALTAEGFTPPVQPAWARTNWQSYCVRLPAGVDQKTVLQSLLDHGIAGRRAVMNSHCEAAYCTHPQADAELGRSIAAQGSGIIVPLFPRMTTDQVRSIVEQLRFSAIHPQPPLTSKTTP